MFYTEMIDYYNARTTEHTKQQNMDINSVLKHIPQCNVYANGGLA